MRQERALAQTKMSRSQIAEMLPQLSASEHLSRRVWNQLGGLDWAGVELLIELHDIGDPEALVADLLTIRNAMQSPITQNVRS